MPRVFIGLPVCNGENYLEGALNSICDQTYENFQLLISDNASNDSTERTARQFAGRDPRILYHRQERNLGAAANFNYCVQCADGKYFKWMAHDDVCEPTYLERCIAVLERDPGAVLCQAHVLKINEIGTIEGPYEREQDFNDPDPIVRFSKAMALNHACVSVFGVMRLDVLRKTPAIAPFPGSDRPLLAELSLYGRFECVTEPLFLWREHPNRSVRLKRYERVTWFDAGAKEIPTTLYRRTRELLAYAKAALRVPMPAKYRFAALLQVFRWGIRNRIAFYKDIRATGSLILGRTAR